MAMTRRGWCAIGLVVAACLLGGRAMAADPPQRNVLLIMADDLRDFGGAYLHDVVKTPNLDRLRARGMTFEHAYVQYPVCNPSRCSMLTGLRAEQTGVVTNTVPLRQAMPDVVTLPQLFRTHGWHTAAFGKIFHLGGHDGPTSDLWSDKANSWDEAVAYKATDVGRRMIEGRNLTAGKLKWCTWGAADGDDNDQPDGQIASAVIADIEKQGDKPWFIGCGFMKPHDPFIAPKKYFDLYPPGSLTLWRDDENTTPAPPLAVSFGAYGEAFGRFTDADRMEFLRAYCAGTTFMDAQLGRVLDTLDRRHLWDRTLVVFVGDHGYHTGERNWWNKNTLFERSCRAPFVVAAPGVKGGQSTRSIVEFVDLYPTVAEFAGLTPPNDLAGKSFAPILRDPDAVIKDAAFTLVSRGPKAYAQSVTLGPWRFTRWSTGEVELYDHSRDPEEMHDVAKKKPDVVRALTERLQSLPAYPPSH
ncbi:MAG: sulfatase-like hydrolase/transferase [Phycisphaera sp.]|nr:sulfatase-like hydrolase/transferase [Phycisphaera sp.]